MSTSWPTCAVVKFATRPREPMAGPVPHTKAKGLSRTRMPCSTKPSVALDVTITSLWKAVRYSVKLASPQEARPEPAPAAPMAGGAALARASVSFRAKSASWGALATLHSANHTATSSREVPASTVLGGSATGAVRK